MLELILSQGNEIPSALADTLRDLAPQINVDEAKGQGASYQCFQHPSAEGHAHVL